MPYLFITSLIWAFSFGLIGNALQGLNPLQVADTRLLLALLVFLPWLKPALISAREKWQLICLGAVQYGLMYTCLLSAFKYIPSHLVALFTVLTPIYIVLIYDIRRRRFTPWYLAAAALSVAGAAVIRVGDTGAEQIWQGFLLMQIANLAFAFGQVYYRDWKRARPELGDKDVFAFLYLGGGAFTALATVAIAGQSPLPLTASTQQWGVLIYLGLIASGLGFFLWNKGATQISPGVLAAFNNAVVPLAMFASLFIFGEAKGGSAEDLVRLGLGSALIIAALLLEKLRGASK
ncbi:MAG: EamA family transporter [Cellvibrionaceae bacterium]|nr:EamA family transporter [Cellvibrionaceae bacterium]